MAACDLLLCKETTTRKLLAAVAQKQVSPQLVSLDERNRLLEHDDAGIREQAERLFGQAAASDRAAVVEKYKPALALQGDKAAGKQVFRRVCSACHQIGNEGNEVGPDIGDLRGKTRAMVLYDILDPNRAVDPRWISYEANLEDGRVLAGIVESDSPAGLVLRRPGGVKDVLSHAEIEEIESSGKSLMPEGFEQEITVEQMADLLEFLKSGR
jgi:putative heme-binding domain-containing protein